MPAEPGLTGTVGGRRPFHVRLDNFDGPFDLLLQLINQRRMDVTEVALHQVTDDFIGHIRAMGSNWDLDQVTEFLVIAATLLDLKAARLLPADPSTTPTSTTTCSRPAICCSPGCWPTAPTSRSRRCSPNWRRVRCAGTRGR